MKHLNLLLILTLIISVFSCKDKKKEEITELVSLWQGKEITFPSHITFTRYLKDTVDYRIPSNAAYKVLVYVDTIGCTSCKLQLPKWKELIAQVDSLTESSVPFLFFFHPKDYKEINYILKRDRFEHPICIDREDALNKQNKFPSNTVFQTFLLDKDNKVVVIGNPVNNLAIKDLYLKELTTGKQPEKKPTVTTAQASPQEINVGKIPVEKAKKVDFIVQNTGNNPLVILETSTTCGCAVATFSKHPAQPGETLQVSVEMTPKESGMFDETIMVKCNTEQPIRLKLRGQAY